MMFHLAKAYSFIYGYAKDRFGVHLPGLGFALRLVRSDRIISVMGRKMYFNHKVAASYARLIAGSWNEPETHLLLNFLIPRLPGSVSFIDVGANIGEMVLDVSRHGNVVQIVAFEPIPGCCHSIRESFKLNGFKNYQIIEKLVGDKCGHVKFSDDGKNTGGSSLYSECSARSLHEVPITTLDNEISVSSDHVIILVDVEGYEPSVLKGGARFIRTERPFIIFEYNTISKKHYMISEIREILGADYDIYRLRQDGRLDGDVENAWNCVAIPKESVFETATGSYVVEF